MRDSEAQPRSLGWWWVKFSAEQSPLCCCLLQFCCFLGVQRSKVFMCLPAALWQYPLISPRWSYIRSLRKNLVYTLNVFRACDESLAAVLALQRSAVIHNHCSFRSSFLILWTQIFISQLKYIMYLPLQELFSVNADCIDNKLYLS